MIVRIIKLLISLLFSFFVNIKNFINKILRRKIHPTVTILYYHSVLKNQQEQFDRQMKLLKRLSIPINLEKKVTLSEGNYYSAVTFDDGFRNVNERALPVLEKYHIPVTIFCLASNFGEKPVWDYYPATPDKFEIIMTPEEIKHLPQNIFSIGSHTVSHSKLSKIPLEKAKYELCESKTKLEEILEREVKLFSFPNGEYSKATIDLAFECGYEKLFTIDPQLASNYENDNIFGRFNVEPSDWLIEFRLKLLGYYRWQMIVKKIKSKINS